MTPSNQQNVSTTLKTLRFPKVGDALADLFCPDCGAQLHIHQPEPSFPDRMLGTCPRCHRWLMADIVTGRDDGVIVLLPEARVFLDQG